MVIKGITQKTYIIDQLKAIKVIGGYKSKGFGMVSISV